MKEKFQKVINLINALNDIERGIGSSPFFEYRVVNGEFRVYGLTAELAQLFSLLWSNVNDYVVYMCVDDYENYIHFCPLDIH